MSSFTGLNRTRKTARSVAIVDRVSRWTITVGGIATILAVATVCLFLLWVVLPLLGGGSVDAATTTAKAPLGPVRAAAEDAYRDVAWTLHDDGEVVLFATADGEVFARERVYDPAEVRCVAAHDDVVQIGRNDGAVATLRIAVTADVLDASAAPPALTDLARGATRVVGQALYQRTPQGQLRRQQLQIDRKEPVQLSSEPVLHVDVAETSSGRVLVGVTADGMLHFKERSVTTNMLTLEETVTLTGASVQLRELVPDLGATLPDHVLLAGAGDNVYLLWNDGRLVRIDARDFEAPKVAELLDTVPDSGQVTAVSFLIGKSTLLIGDDSGTVSAWFRIKPDGADTIDGSHLVRARQFRDTSASPVVSIDPSQRSRLFACGHRDGHISVFHGTSARLVAATTLAKGETLELVRLCPKEDGLLGLGAAGVHRWDLHPGHPEMTLATAFLPVWYEGYAEPVHAWQSTSGSDDFEPKFGLWPLVFGTLKATFYCLLFGVPLALLAAIYTSEFLPPRRKARIKPLIELMASLPSVVLGFLAALVFAPIVEEYLMALLTMTLTVPLVFLLGAQLWQRIPANWRPIADRWRLLATLLAVPLGLWLGQLIGPLFESMFFDGDIKHWLAVSTRDPDTGGEGASAFGGWFFVLLPLAGVLSALGITFFDHTALGRRLPQSGLARFGIGAAVSLVFAVLAGSALTGLGWDLRGNLVGTFDQRNSLVVGFVMGFAVIPIIYTIAEDALSAVPEHLRAASLGAGATQWQTAVRIILPTALSGVFSAIMIGLGRAVGETMIVLMAAGNTALLDMNVFNGFRTLSANIATELPEAVRDSTHYRTLYLAALCLFVMTFALNTLAEVVRQRFRKRAFQL
ncbi:MAG: ABC transporter permease subunit [Planctomycetes bacterium]|nr:ABC transporter permease subunit [Planctomycetota bacterium]